MAMTTIAIKKESAEKLDKIKVHPNQSYAEIIEQLLENMESKND